MGVRARVIHREGGGRQRVMNMYVCMLSTAYAHLSYSTACNSAANINQGKLSSIYLHDLRQPRSHVQFVLPMPHVQSVVAHSSLHCISKACPICASPRQRSIVSRMFILEKKKRKYN